MIENLFDRRALWAVVRMTIVLTLAGNLVAWVTNLDKSVGFLIAAMIGGLYLLFRPISDNLAEKRLKTEELEEAYDELTQRYQKMGTEAQQVVKSLRESLASSEQSLAALRQSSAMKVQSLTAENESLTASLHSLTASMQSLTEESLSLLERYESLAAEKQAVEQSLAEKEQSLQAAENRCRAVETSLALSEERYHELLPKLQEAEATAAALQDMKARNRSLAGKVARLSALSKPATAEDSTNEADPEPDPDPDADPADGIIAVHPTLPLFQS